ncbi:phytanoyl-CoA dioxygenase family protein [Micromonospora foliorum]|uniref:phytanoyl-CoA dioxygenase family protein n=1 Tax=Micromonospora foliorum TaxID=2911210 RepID=UPI001EE8F43B|nr:phytanoyl-CoA dioxygenase family protein [Micromonospora foliorum]MCG5438988.1 phytanoyl-CoA dioxygenase family protein [Micromonospora foliorum]
MVEFVRVTSDAPLDDVVTVLERDGCIIIENFVDQATLDGLWEDLGPLLDGTRYSKSGYDGHLTRRVSSLFRRTSHLTPIFLHPLYLGAARQIMEKPVHMWVGQARIEMTPNIQISATQAIQIDPGQGRQPLHRDDSLHLRRHPGPTTRVQLMLALSEFTQENGATLVIPGSHHWDDERAPRYNEAIPAAMPAGSALLWLGGVYHGGGGNVSTEPRTSLTVSYDLGNLRQEENQFLAVPRDVVLTLPEEVQRLLGYDRCPPGVGWYEMEDPHILLTDPDADPAVLESPART